MTPRDLLTNYPSFPTNGGGGRIRTFEGVSRQIYSLLPLAAWVPLPEKTSRVFSLRPPRVSTALARLLLCLSTGPTGIPRTHVSALIYIGARRRNTANRG